MISALRSLRPQPARLVLPLLAASFWLIGCSSSDDNVLGKAVARIFNRLERMDPATGKLTPIARTDAKRSSANVIAAGGKIYVIGGFGEDLKLVGAVEAYDPAAGTWTSLAPWTTPRLTASMVESSGQICASPGAFDLALANLAIYWDCYDIATDEWRSVDRPGHQDAVSIGAHGGGIYALGGYDLDTGKPLATAFRYDISKTTWTVLASMPAPCDTLYTITAGDTLYAFGCNSGKPSTEFFAYDVLADTWSTPPPPPAAVNFHYPNQPSTYGNGFVFFTNQNGGEVWRYDATTPKWSKSPPLPANAGSFTSALIGDTLYVRLYSEKPTASSLQDSGKIYAYDLLAEQWTALDEATAEHNLYMQAVAEGGSIYYVGDETEIVIVAQE